MTPRSTEAQHASAPSAPAGALPDDVRGRIIERAVLSRAVDSRLLELFSEGKLFGTVHTCIGQEFTGATLAEFLQDGDTVFSTHRCHGHFLSWIGDVEGLVAELMGRATGICRGIGGSQHLHAPGFYSSGIQGGTVPVAAGVALAAKLAGDGRIAVAMIGDGTLGEGTLYEALNLISLWRLPVLIVLEDNDYAQSTPKAQALAGEIRARFAAFGIRVWQGDTWQWPALCDEFREACDYVRTGGAPACVIVKTYRLKAHSKGDDLRSSEEIGAYSDRDPLTILERAEDPVVVASATAARSRIERAIVAADAAAFPDPEPSFAPRSEVGWRLATLRPIRVLAGLNEALRHALDRDPRVMIIGEDLEDPYGGAFKVTQGLSDAFPGRVRNTPISEACIVGTGTGLALAGYRPIVEIMFGDFSLLAFDQIINHAAKFQQMYRLGRPVNLIVRTPMGGGRGYGPTHSQSLEKHFFGAPGLRVVALNTLVDPGTIYDQLLTEDSGVTLVVEHKTSYGAFLRARVPDGFELWHSDEGLPAAWLRPHASTADVTLVGYGGMSDVLVDTADRLFEEHDLVAQVLCVTQICPLAIERYAQVFAAPSTSSPRLRLGQAGQPAAAVVIVEEGQAFAGFGAEVSAQITARVPEIARRLTRVCALPEVVPSSGPLEKRVLPGIDAVCRAALEVTR